MGRQPGLDEKKTVSIISVLARYPEGVWLRKLAEETGLNHTTVARYLASVLKPLVEDVGLAGKQRAYLRVIKLKASVLQELENGKDLNHILKLLKMMSNYK